MNEQHGATHHTPCIETWLKVLFVSLGLYFLPDYPKQSASLLVLMEPPLMDYRACEH